MNTDLMWYSPRDTLNKQRLYNFDVGARGCGKTTGGLIYIFEEYEKDKTFNAVWVRRYKTETEEAIPDILKTLPLEFKLKYKCSIKGKKLIVDEHELVTFKTLSVSGRVKGVASESLGLIVFDEFIIDKNSRYLKNEFEVFNSFYDTIARPADPKRKRVPVLFFSNAMSMFNPYFDAFNITFNDKGKFLSKHVSAQILESKEFREHARTTDFAEMLQGTDYIKHSIDNEFFIDKLYQPMQRTPESKLLCVFKLNDKHIGVWADFKKDLYFVSMKHDINFKLKFNVYATDGKQGYFNLRLIKNYQIFNLIKYAIDHNKLYVEDKQSQNLWLKLIKLKVF